MEPAINDTLIADGTVLAAASKYAPHTKVWCDTHNMFHDRRADPDATYNVANVDHHAVELLRRSRHLRR